MVDPEKRKTKSNWRTERRAVALLITLSFVVIVFTLGLSFASRTAFSAPQAENRYARARAQALAASGVSIAAHYLIHPPTSISACSFWPGTGGVPISIDGGPDTCTIGVSRSTSDPRLFTVVSTGTAVDRYGVERSRRTITADIVLPPPNRWCVRPAYLGSVAQTFPGLLRFFGDLHVNGSINSLAWSQSIVSATSTITWWPASAYGPPSQTLPNQPVRVIPSVSTTNYAQYLINGTTYSALTFSNRDLNASAPPNNGAAVTSSNPGGVLVSTNGSAGSRVIRFKNNVNYIGTIVVDGDAQLDGTNVRITPVSGYPALVVSRDLAILSNDKDLTINGPVLVGGTIRQGLFRSTITINGPVISGGSIAAATSGSMLDIRSTATSEFFNFSGLADRQPYTILRWYEN